VSRCEHQAIAYQGAATEPLYFIVSFPMAEASGKWKFLGFRRRAVHNQGSGSMAGIHCLVGNGCIGEKEANGHALFEDNLLELRAS